MNLPDGLQHLQNIINGAKNQPNHCESLLRKIIKQAADDAPRADVIRIAEAVLQCGIDADNANLN